jgi:anti-sigma regulatory factor (Ser/Thr protein kinase)
MAALTRLKVSAKMENLGRLIESVSSCAKAQGFEKEKISKIELAAEEALVNIIHYAYPERPGDVEMICQGDRGRLIVEIIDSGIPFDFTTMPDPDVTAGIEEREPGGLGIFFIKKMMDEVRYRRENDRNILTLIIQKR